MDIRERAVQKMATASSYQRGVSYYRQKLVALTKVEAESFSARVRGTSPYTVHIHSKGDDYLASCTCPYDWGGICKHVVAALLAARDYYDIHAEEMMEAQIGSSSWEGSLNEFIKTSEPSPSKPIRWQLIYSLQPGHQLPWIVSPYMVYIRKDGNLGKTMKKVSDYFLQSGSFPTDATDRLIITWLNSIPDYSMDSSYYSTSSTRRWGMNEWEEDEDDWEDEEFEEETGLKKTIADVLPLLKGKSLYLGSSEAPMDRPITVSEEPANLFLRLQAGEDGLRLFPVLLFGESEKRLDSKFKIITNSPLWLLEEDRLIPVSGDVDGKDITSFTKKDQNIIIPQAEEDNFYKNYFPSLARQYRILAEDINWKTVEVSPLKRLYLQEDEKELRILLHFSYEDWEVAYQEGVSESILKDENELVFYRIQRRREEEEEVRERLLKEETEEITPGVCRPLGDPLTWLAESLPKLIEGGFEIYGEEDLNRYRLNRRPPSLQLVVSSEIDWFDVQVVIRFGDAGLPLASFREALKKGSRFARLDDGSVGMLPEEWLAKYKHLFDLAEEAEEGVRVSKYHLSLIDELYGEADERQVDKEFIKRRKRLRKFESIQEKPRPRSFDGELRPYQKAGYDWLYFLKDFGFGGCLADDMGLGKTIQALALLANEKRGGTSGPSLVVTPVSVAFNWVQEAARFTPGLKVYRHTGIDRQKASERFNDYDIIVTTYGTMRKDIELLKDHPFHYIILDESQNIKNPASQTAKAAKLLNAKNRLVLTGTPVENNTLELWSQFSFINPGLLGNVTYFKDNFAKAIDRDHDEEAASMLKRLIYPFILRRTKEQVATELPPKVETISYCDLKPAQRRLYDKWRDYYRAAILGTIDSKGMNRSQMKILEGLMKLRQICCHPHLIDKGFRGPSGKLELLNELLDEVISEKHKVLVFSQFVKMLRVIRDHLDNAGITYEYLDGRTRDRQGRVEHFQEDASVPIFLISLRAGGTGLNLTAADYVIHVDPWWNPAVELQATDRTHRIGQTKKVFAYKLIAKDTVEEKVLELQERKKKLVSQLITTDSGFFKGLTREDVQTLFS